MAFSWNKLADILVKSLAVAIPIMEKIGTAHSVSGPDKKAAVLDLVAAGIGGLDTLAPQVLADPKVQAALSVANDAIVAVHNVVSNVQATHAAAAPIAQGPPA